MQSLPRPTWIEYFLMIAKLVSLRSHDTETRHGCVITKDNRIVATGYNGLPKGMKDDWVFPNTRPDKYPFMKHSEQNAVWNLVQKYEDMVAYVTGEPCNDCLHAMWQAGVKEVYYIIAHGSHLITEKTREERRLFLSQSGMKLHGIGYVNVEWLDHATWIDNRST
jgi:dCMP deaminase